MKPSEPLRSRQPSLQDYLVRYDLAAMEEEARLDYSNSVSGGPRHLSQQDIAARFRAVHPSAKASDEPS
jgi:hypothetical protein